MKPHLLFTALGVGATAVAATLSALRLSGAAVVDIDADLAATVGYGSAAAAASLIAAAHLAMKRRVPARMLGQTPEQYWRTPATAQAALVFWALLEGAVMVATVGFFLTGLMPVAAVIAAALVIYWISGPSTLAGR
jgi:hypothetical protein